MWKASSVWENTFGVRQFYFLKYQNNSANCVSSPHKEYPAVAELSIQIHDASCQAL